MRTDEQMGTFGNRIMLMSAPLFTNEPDAGRAGCRRPTSALAAMKEHHRALPAELLQDTNHFIPPAVFARAARATFAISTAAAGGRPGTWSSPTSRARSSRSTAPARGWSANYPVSVITDGMGLNMTVMSYCGKMDFGIVADRDQMPDLWSMLDRLRDSLEELK